MSELRLSEARLREERAPYFELSFSETTETACTLMEGRFRCIAKKCRRKGREQEEVQPTARADDACRHFLQDSPYDARRCVCLCFLLPFHVFERDEFFYALSPHCPVHANESFALSLLVNTTVNPRIRRTPAHVFFLSRGSRLESSSQDSKCLSQNSHASHLAQHVARAFLVVSFTIEHYLTFHLHSSPTFHSTTYLTFTDVIFTRGFTPRRSIKCVFRSCG